MARLRITDLDREQQHETYEVETADGTVFELVDPQDLPLGALVKLEQSSPMDQLRAIVADGRFDEFAGKPDVTARVFAQILEDWRQTMGLGEPGESPASPRSSNGTARRSKPTSRSVASTSGRSSGNGRSARR